MCVCVCAVNEGAHIRLALFLFCVRPRFPASVPYAHLFHWYSYLSRYYSYWPVCFFILLLFLLPCSHQHCVFIIAYSFLALCCHGSCTGRAKQPVKYSLTRIATVEVRSPPPHCSSLLAGSEPIDCRIA